METTEPQPANLMNNRNTHMASHYVQMRDTQLTFCIVIQG